MPRKLSSRQIRKIQEGWKKTRKLGPVSFTSEGEHKGRRFKTRKEIQIGRKKPIVFSKTTTFDSRGVLERKDTYLSTPRTIRGTSREYNEKGRLTKKRKLSVKKTRPIPNRQINKKKEIIVPKYKNNA